MPQFDSKTFNGEVFGKYVDRIPTTTRHELLKSGALVINNKLKEVFGPQTGSFKSTLPFFGKIGKSTQNYDGATDITANSSETYSQSYIVVGRADAWTEKDFSEDITGGVNFMDNVAAQLGQYWDDVDTETLTAILKGIFAMSYSTFVNNHTYDISASASPNFGATTMNNAIQKAAGDNKAKFVLSIMHSQVATNLENLQLLEYLKYTDKEGITRNLQLGTVNGKLVLIDDTVPTEDVAAVAAVEAVAGVYVRTSDVTLDNTKTYYTVSNNVYSRVTSPDVADIGSYYEQTTAPVAAVEAADAYTKYTTFVFGQGAIEYCDVGAKVPYEMDRNPARNGGEDTLYGRKRKVFAPHGISFIGTPESSSPTDTELETGANWDVVNNGKNGNDKKYIDHKAIAIARIITRG